MDSKVKLYFDGQSFESALKCLSPYFTHPLSIFQTNTEFHFDQINQQQHHHHHHQQQNHVDNNHVHLKIKCLFDAKDIKASSINAIVSVQNFTSYEEEHISLDYTHELFSLKEGSHTPQSLQNFSLVGRVLSESGPFKMSQIIFVTRRVTNLFDMMVYFETFTASGHEYHRIHFLDTSGEGILKITSHLGENSVPYVLSTLSKRDYILQTTNTKSTCCQLDDNFKCPFDTTNSGPDSAPLSWDEPLGLLDMEDLGNYFDVTNMTETKLIDNAANLSNESIHSQQNIKISGRNGGSNRRQKSEVPEEEAIIIQKKRNCEASARYRRKKQKEEEETKKQLSESRAENKKLMKKVAQLEQIVQSLTTDKKVLEAKLEAFQAAGVGVYLQKIV